MPLYKERVLLFVKSLTPLHVGTGRSYASHVDLPVQRDELGFPVIWASSLKGAIKSNIIEPKVRKCFGPEPGEAIESSRVALTDAKLLFIPVRVLKGNIYAYMTSINLLENLKRYLEAFDAKFEIKNEILGKLKEGETLVSDENLLVSGKVVLNEMTLKGTAKKNLIGELGLDNLLPLDIKSMLEKGLIIAPDKDNTSLNLVNRSILIQYRVKLDRDTKRVASGPWSEEYLPSGTVFVSLMLCSGEEAAGKDDCGLESIKKEIDSKVIFVGGKETIGKGLVKLYMMQPKHSSSHGGSMK